MGDFTIYNEDMTREDEMIAPATDLAATTEMAEATVISGHRPNVFVRVWRFYYDGFRNMTIGKYLWIIILAKLAVMFLVFKLFFFPNLLERDYSTDEERAEAVRTHLIER